VVHAGNILEATHVELDLAFALNVRAMFDTIRAVLPGMIAPGDGSIINIASVTTSVIGVPNRLDYGTNKGRGHRTDQGCGRRPCDAGYPLQRHLSRNGRQPVAARAPARDARL
jgi:NAD(P)-dependent dehydrogenase (short-subunit alcohol dehydrogenase family)